MDLDALRVFVRVAELGSFTRAAEQLGLSKAAASLRVRALEEELGASLLQRSTRVVRLTTDGEQLVARARKLVADADDIATLFRPRAALRGRVRVDLPVHFARELFMPRVPGWLTAHPELELVVSATDRRVDVVREGFDCVLSIGTLRDSGLVAKRLGVLSMLNCASPAYLDRRGTPTELADLERHVVVHYSHALGAEDAAFEYPARKAHAGGWALVPMRSLVTVNNADAYLAACLAGLGIIQVPRYGMRAYLADGSLVEILPTLTAAPMPVSLVHAYGTRVPRRVRAVMAWIEEAARAMLG
ncbi:MAG: LysR family transcriptional regulator [Polyangiaceae bacterium]